MVEIELGFKGLIRVIILCLIGGIVIGNQMYGHWLAFLVWTPLWVLPVWFYLIPVGIVCVYFLKPNKW